MIKALLFDFDGTVVNSMEDLADIAAMIMSRNYNFNKEIARRLYLETSGLPFCEQIEIIFPAHSLNNQTVFEFEELKEQEFLNHPLYDDTRDTLNYLMEKGYKVIISSNNFEHIIQQYFNKHNLKVDMLLGYKPGFGKGKEHFQYVLEKFNFDKSEIVFIGDSIQDGKKASNFGIAFIGKEGINKSQDFKAILSSDLNVIKGLNDLKTIF